MPIDKMMLDPMLNTFRQMVEDCKTQNISGENFDKMCETLNRMEQLGQENNDFNAFNAQIMQENLFGSFSDYYSKALSEKAKNEAGCGEGGGYNDKALLQQSINGLKQAIKANEDSFKETIDTAKNFDVEENMSQQFEMAKQMGLDISDEMKQVAKNSKEKELKEKPNMYDNSVEVEVLKNPADIIKPIQDLINLGEQEGMTFPNFLRLQIEKGLDKAMEGAIVARKGLETEKEFILAGPVSPYHIQQIEKKLTKFDELAAKHKFGVPNWKELNMAINDIDREFEPQIIKFNTIKKMWEKLIDDLSLWSLSYCSFAPHVFPWDQLPPPEVKEAIIRDQKITPGIFKERLKLSEKYFGMSFPNILQHESFKWAVKYNYIDYSQEYLVFLIEVILPECKPFNDLSQDIINKKETLYKDKKQGNPERHFPAIKLRVFYDAKFGEGRHESKFGTIAKSDSNAKPWDIESFKY